MKKRIVSRGSWLEGASTPTSRGHNAVQSRLTKLEGVGADWKFLCLSRAIADLVQMSTSIRNHLPGTIEEIVSDKVVSEIVITLPPGR
jgi:hypothetical protein